MPRQRSRQPENELHGALLIDKPSGPTSHDIVDIIRGQYGIQKVGHCGTLDPAATGLLILLLGRATKLSMKLTADHKIYEGSIEFGKCTDSYDAQGDITATAEIGDTIRLSITDQGRGFGETDMTRVTTRYQRGANVGDIVGSGLGLTIADEVARAHGGGIEIIQNPEGTGTCVCLFLPR